MSLSETERERDLAWPTEISNLDAKLAVAEKLVTELDKDQVIGVGSGSTSFVVLKELAKSARDRGIELTVVVTSYEFERAAVAMGIRVVPVGQYRVDWSFDGADEVDPKARLIKGRGGAMFREKMLMARSQRRYIVADQSKMVSKLGEKFAVPVEVVPTAVDVVRDQLEGMGAFEAPLRMAGGKDGPVFTEHRGVILDTRFSDEVPPEADLEAVCGVIATGLFDRWPYELITA